MIVDEVAELLKKAVQEHFRVEIEPRVDWTDLNFGDLSSNIGFELAAQLSRKPAELAQELVEYLSPNISKIPAIGQIKAAGGYINIWLEPKWLEEQLDSLTGQKNNPQAPKKEILIEFTDPNPFKEFHIGHLYSNVIGEALCRLMEATGATVHRLCYQGDVGMHVAKSVWGIKQLLTERGQGLEDIPPADRSQFLGEAYAVGAAKFEEDPEVKAEITELNKKIYEQSDEEVNKLYQTGRQWSLDYFETLYNRLGTKFERYYFERETGEEGAKVVREYLKKGVFEESDGAVVYRGEKHGLHTRVFINSQGFPTYEAKDLGLALIKAKDYTADTSLIITGNEVDTYFKVMLAALAEINPKIGKQTRHLSHGMVKLPSGKMSSRTGKVITAAELIEEVKKAIQTASPEAQDSEANALAALKYTFLASSIGRDIIFDITTAISLSGNSGPYLQYTFARARSILSKAKEEVSNSKDLVHEDLNLARQLVRYQTTLQEAAMQLSPHLLANYLFALSQQFNTYYEHHPVLKAQNAAGKLRLVRAVSEVLKEGLDILGIKALDRM